MADDAPAEDPGDRVGDGVKDRHDPIAPPLTAGQSPADRDQRLSDADQASSESDQLLADRDQAAADRDLGAGVDPAAHAVTRQARRRTKRKRDRAASARLSGTEQRRTAALESPERFRSSFDHAQIAMEILALDGSYEDVNEAFCTLVGHTPDELLGQPRERNTHPDDVADDAAALRSLIAGDGGTHTGEKRYIHASGHVIWARTSLSLVRDDSGRPLRLIAQVQDLTERRGHEQHLQQVAEEHLRAVTDSMRDAECTLNGAGHITHMNPAAQRLLGWDIEKLRGRTLHDVVHDHRSGPSARALEDCPLHLATRATAPTHCGDDSFRRRDGSQIPVSWVVTAVEGVPGDRSVIVFSDNTASKLEQARLLLEKEQLAQIRQLSDALDEDRFELFAQPIVDLATGATVSHELLLRMRERDGTMRTPASLLPAAEASGLIRDLDRWVLRKGAQLAGEGHRIELNLSAASLDEPQLFDDFAQVIADYGADPGLIVIELTETALMQDAAVATTFIERIRALGCEFALDDFGTGFGGFSYIKHLPVDYLKIDIEFVRDLHANTASQHVVQAVVQLAGAFGQRTIAEGVEDAETLDLLRAMGVDYAQGYLLGRPASLASTLYCADTSASPAPAGGELPDTAAAQRSDGVGAASPGVLPRRRHGDVLVDRLARAYLDTLRVGDPHSAAAVIDDALRSGLPCVEIQSRVIAPAMWAIGELWERGGLTVAQEHLATALSHHVLARLYPGLLRRAPRRGDTVVVAAAAGEHHILGLRMVADVFEGAGFDVRFLGADVPPDSLASLIAEHRPGIVALGITMPLGAATLVRQLQQLRERDPQLQVIVGGQGVPAVLRRGAGVMYAADTEQLTRYVNGGFAAQPPAGELPDGIARGGVRLGPFAGTSDATAGLESLLAQTTAAAADAARGQARRSFMLEQLAFRDPLTDLWNRRAFDDRYEELTRVESERAPTILMIDIDRFKSVNDDHGHDAGDRALVGVARSITRALRPDDFAARYGGDEFVILLPATTREDAARIGERIRSHVEDDLEDPPLTVSIGIAAPDHSSRRRATLDVDRALYEAKERGRNQVAFA